MPNENHIILDKELRRDIDAIIQRLRGASSRSAIPRPTISELEAILEKKGSESVDIAPNGEVTVGVRASRERSLAITKLQEAVMWLGMDLKAINEEQPGARESPYPNSKNPGNLKIDPTADGLRM